MDKKIYLVGKIITWVIMGLSAILVIGLIIQSSDMKKVTEETVNSPLLNYSFYLAYIAFAISIIVAIIFPIINIVAHPKTLIRFLIFAVAVVVMGLISYLLESMGDNSLSAQDMMRLDVSETTSMWVGIGIYFTYIMFLLSILAIIYSAVRNLFKK